MNKQPVEARGIPKDLHPVERNNDIILDNLTDLSEGLETIRHRIDEIDDYLNQLDGNFPEPSTRAVKDDPMPGDPDNRGNIFSAIQVSYIEKLSRLLSNMRLCIRMIDDVSVRHKNILPHGVIEAYQERNRGAKHE